VVGVNVPDKELSVENTIFDKILAGEIPCDKVYEDSFVLAFKDINPKAPVHVLVIPKHRIERYSEVQDQDVEVIGQFHKSVSKVASELNLDKNGYRVVFNCGQDGGQEVEYLHAHILGGRALHWPAG